MENTEIKTFADIKGLGPFIGNRIYLESADSHLIIAVCSTPEIASLLAYGLNDGKFIFSDASTDAKPETKDTVRSYANLVQAAYYLDIAILQAKIPVNSINAILLEKSYAEFKQCLDLLIEKEHLVIEKKEVELSAACSK